MNCCNPMTGACEQEQDCPVREAAHTKAAHQFYCMKVQMFDKPALHIRAWDWIGNTAERFWQGFTQAFRDAWAIVTHPGLWISIGAITLCAGASMLAALVVFR